MAQLIEEVSVLAAEKRRKEPRQVRRPGDDRPAAVQGETRQQQAERIAARSNRGGKVLSHQDMLQLHAERMGVKYVPPGAPAGGETP